MIFSCDQMPTSEFSCASRRAPKPCCWGLLSCHSTSLCEWGSLFHFEQDRSEGSWGTSPVQLHSLIEEVTSAERPTGSELKKCCKFGALHVEDAISRFRISFAENWCKSFGLWSRVEPGSEMLLTWVSQKKPNKQFGPWKKKRNKGKMEERSRWVTWNKDQYGQKVMKNKNNANPI